MSELIGENSAFEHQACYPGAGAHPITYIIQFGPLWLGNICGSDANAVRGVNPFIREYDRKLVTAEDRRAVIQPSPQGQIFSYGFVSHVDPAAVDRLLGALRLHFCWAKLIYSNSGRCEPRRQLSLGKLSFEKLNILRSEISKFRFLSTVLARNWIMEEKICEKFLSHHLPWQSIWESIVISINEDD